MSTGTQSRTMVVWAPDWPVVAADAPASAAVAVLDKGQVLACSQSARAQGVRRGMRRRDAQSRAPGLILRPYTPDADARAFEAVLTEIEKLSPGVSPLRPGLCALGVPSRFYGGEVEAAAVIAERLVDVGVWDVRTGVADGLFAAEQAARRCPPQDSVIVPPGQSARFLCDLPVDVLGDADLVGLLRRLGLLTLGDFASLAPADVHTRFGSHGALLHRLARGDDPQPIGRRRVPVEFDASVVFEPPLELVESIAFSVRTTAERFVEQLGDHGLVCTTVLIEVDADGVLASARRWMHPRWFGAGDIVDRVRWQLSSKGVIEAPVDAVRLIPEVTEPLGDHASSLFGGGPDERVERGVARVQSLVGHESVVQVQIQGGRGPAQRRLTTPWGERPQLARSAAQPWPGTIPPPVPATVFAEPVAAQVVGADGQPVGLSDRGALSCEPDRFRIAADMGWKPVASWAGPWPVDEQWWDHPDTSAAAPMARFQLVGVDGSAYLMLAKSATWWTEAHYT
jgi:protein ImuB